MHSSADIRNVIGNAISTLTIEMMAVQRIANDGCQWVKLIPAGRFQGRDGRGPYILTDAQTVIDQTRAYHGQTKISIDYDHQSVAAQKVGGTAVAAGWIIELEARPEGIFGAVEWTKRAAAHLGEHEYRYLSPVFAAGKTTGEVKILLNAALTNSPNLEGLEAVAHARMIMKDTFDADQVARAAAIMGLDPEKDREAIITKLADLADLLGMTATSDKVAEPDPAKFVPMAVFQETAVALKQLRQGVTRNTAERHVKDAISAGKLLPFMRDWAVELCTVNMPAFEVFVTNLGPSVSGIVAPQLGRGGRPNKSAPDLTDTEINVCRTLGLTAEEFSKSRITGTETE